MFMSEHALDSEAGACAILEALARRPMPDVQGPTIGEALRQASTSAFRDLVRLKADEALERASVYEGASP